ncbi:MAG: hypothetical protein IKN38_03760 [Clostridia bacterium]|nr:hypothetical protein [Clostridia bacterium]
MTRNYSTNENSLCEVLKQNFENRGVNNPNVINKVSLYKEKQLMQRRAEARRELAEKNAKASDKVTPGLISAKHRMPGREYRRPRIDSFRYENDGFIAEGGLAETYERASSIRERASKFDPAAYERRRHIVKEAKDRKAEPKKKKSFGEVLSQKLYEKRLERAEASRESFEKVVKKKSIPKGLVASILVCTLLLMVVLYTYSTYTETVARGKALQNEKIELQLERDRVQSLYELRDDVREIEDYAVNTIGMVKSDLVETRYVSIAGGERIEVIRAEEPEEGEGFFSTFLSAIGTNWERLMDYID